MKITCKCKNCYYFDGITSCKAIISSISKSKIIYKTTTKNATCDLWQSVEERDWDEAAMLALTYIDYIKERNAELHTEVNGVVLQRNLPAITIEQYIKEVLNGSD